MELSDVQEIFNCPECGMEISYLQSTCANCHSELDWGNDALPVNDADFVVCTSCQREVPRNAKFCNECGAPVVINGYWTGGGERILPKCPQCGEELDYAAQICDSCGAHIEWKSGTELLVSLEAFREHDTIPRQNKPRQSTNYGNCTLKFSTVSGKLKPNSARVTIPKYAVPPTMQYNSFGVYSGSG